MYILLLLIFVFNMRNYLSFKWARNLPLISENSLPIVDIDECVSGKHSCHDNATCTNSLGSYSCECKAEYRGNGFFCEGWWKYINMVNNEIFGWWFPLQGVLTMLCCSIITIQSFQRKRYEQLSEKKLWKAICYIANVSCIYCCSLSLYDSCAVPNQSYPS